MDIEVGNYNEEEVKQTIKRIKEKLEAVEKFENDFKEKYGITTYYFLKEMFYVLDHSDMKNSTTTHGNVITADYLGIELFIDKIVEEVKSYMED